MMMNGMGTGTGSTMIAGYRLADWATGLVLLLMSILIVALVGGLLSVAIVFVKAAFQKKDAELKENKSAEAKR